MEIRAWPGKSAPDGGHEHPAVFHMLDVVAVAEILLALHDLGKIGEMFREGIRWGRSQSQPHWCTSATAQTGWYIGSLVTHAK